MNGVAGCFFGVNFNILDNDCVNKNAGCFFVFQKQPALFIQSNYNASITAFKLTLGRMAFAVNSAFGA